jgi:multiple sugar transport system permease protein
MSAGERSAPTWVGLLFLSPYAVLCGMFLLAPLCYGLLISGTRWEMLTAAPPAFVGLANYREALHDEYFWKALWATTRFVVLAVPLTVGLAVGLAAGLLALPGRAQMGARAAVFIPTLISISVVGILWRWFFNTEFGLFNAYLAPVGLAVPWLTEPRWAMKAIVLMTLWWTLGGPTLLLLAAMQQIPLHYYEAAALDGAGRLRQFWHITLPLVRPVLLFVVVMTTIAAFQVFGQTFLVTRGGPEHSTRVLVQYIYETAFSRYRMGYAAAMSWLLFGVIALLSAAQALLLWRRQ